MIQFNLIPSIKKEYLNLLRIRNLVVFISITVTSISFIIFVILFTYVTFFQSNNLNNIDKIVQSKSVTLTGNSNLNKILTIQNQLKSLPQVESNLPEVSQLFTYLNQLTPVTATISNITADFSQNIMTIKGNADSLATVNQFVDTLKFTNYSISGSSDRPAFSNVVLTSFSYNSSSSSTQQSNATYEIDFSFDSNIFANSSNVTLKVPNLITTRSILDQPLNIFKNNNATN